MVYSQYKTTTPGGTTIYHGSGTSDSSHQTATQAGQQAIAQYKRGGGLGGKSEIIEVLSPSQEASRIKAEKEKLEAIKKEEAIKEAAKKAAEKTIAEAVQKQKEAGQQALLLQQQQTIQQQFEEIAQKRVEAIAREEEKKIKEIKDREGNVRGYEYNNMSISSDEGLQKQFEKKVGEVFNQKFIEETAKAAPQNAKILAQLERKGTVAERINYFTQKAMRAQEGFEKEVYQREANKIANAIKEKNYVKLIALVPTTTLKGLGVTASGALLEASVGTINDITQLTAGGAGKALVAGLLSGEIKIGTAASDSLKMYKEYFKANPSSAFGRTIGAIFDVGEIGSIAAAGKLGKVGKIAKLKIAEKALVKAGKNVDNVIKLNLKNLKEIGSIQTIRKVLTDNEIGKYLSGSLTKTELEDITRKVATVKKIDLPVPTKISAESIQRLNKYKKALQEAQRKFEKVDYAKLRRISKKVETPYKFELKGKALFSRKKILDQKSRKVITEEFGTASVKKLPKGDVTIKELKKFEGAVFSGKKGGYSEAITIDKNGWTKGVKEFKNKYKVEYIVQPNGKATFKYYLRVGEGGGKTMLSPLFRQAKQGNYKLVGTVLDYVNPKAAKISSIRDKLFMPKTGVGRTAFGTLNYSASAAGWRKIYGKVGDYRMTLKQAEKRTVRQLVSPLELRTTSRFRGYTNTGKKFRRTEFEAQYLNAMITKNGMTNGQLADVVKKEIKSFVTDNASGIVKVKREIYTPVVANIQKNMIEMRYKLRAMNGKKSLLDKFKDLSKRLQDSQMAAARFRAGMNKRASASLMNFNRGVNNFDPLGALELKKLLNRKIDLANPNLKFSDPMLDSLKGLDVQLPALKLEGIGREYLEFLARRTILLRRSVEILRRRGINVQKLLTKIRQSDRVIQRQRSIQRVRQRQLQANKQLEVKRNINISRGRNIRLRLPRIKLPKKKKEIPLGLEGGKSKMRNLPLTKNSFRIEIKRGNRYIKLNNKLYTERDAKNKLAFSLDRDKSRTARIVNVGKGRTSIISSAERNYLARNSKKFRSYRILNKKKTNLSSVRLIEKRKYFNDLERLSKKRRR